MFYAQFVLAKKGPLAKIWLAAHWEKKLTKAQVFETDVTQAVQEVIKPKVKMALRTTGHLLLGIVRIYSKKARYLLADTNEAFLKMRLNFRALNLHIQELIMEEDDVNQEEFEEMNITIPEFLQAEAEFELQANQTRLEDITLRDNLDMFGEMQPKRIHELFGGDDFGDGSLMYGSLHSSSLHTPAGSQTPIEVARSQSSLFEFNDDKRRDQNVLSSQSFQIADRKDLVRHEEEYVSGIEQARDGSQSVLFGMEQAGAELSSVLLENRSLEKEVLGGNYDFDEMGFEEERRTPSSFALEPLDNSHLEVRGKGKKTVKKRKLIVDDVPSISNEQLKEHMQDFSDMVAPMAVAPPTRKMMNMCVSGDLQHLMSTTGMLIGNKEIREMYQGLSPQAFVPGPEDQMRREEWSDLELSEDISDDGAAMEDGRLDDFFDLEAYDVPIGDGTIAAPAPLEDASVLFGNQDNTSGVGFGAVPDEDTENDFDPFLSSLNSRAGRLENYGFGKRMIDESKWAKRTNQMLVHISSQFEHTDEVKFSTILENVTTRKSAAEHFYSLLSLAKLQAIQVNQGEPYGEISISRGLMIEDLLNKTSSSMSSERPPLRVIQ